jgi:two-component system, NarL family, sensor histidine kinase UhpB
MRRRTLLTQVLVANLILIVVATVAASFATNPDYRLSDSAAAPVVLALAIGLTVAVNVFMLSRRFEPLEHLVDEMERVDLSRPGANLQSGNGQGGPEEVQRLQRAFRRMLERLEAERRRTAGAALRAQEEERARLARDLHDEVNQSLTGLLLRLEAARAQAPPELADEIAETKALANQAMEELLRLARQLRPTALDDLGLKAAIASDVEQLGRQTRIETSFASEGDVGALDQDAQIVVYRVAQEATSNAARHANAEHIDVHLRRDGDRIQLVVADDGRGFSFDEASSGLGISGMRERALLVGGELEIESRPQLGTRVTLRV